MHAAVAQAHVPSSHLDVGSSLRRGHRVAGDGVDIALGLLPPVHIVVPGRLPLGPRHEALLRAHGTCNCDHSGSGRIDPQVQKRERGVEIRLDVGRGSRKVSGGMRHSKRKRRCRSEELLRHPFGRGNNILEAGRGIDAEPR